MPRSRKYEAAADRQAAYRARTYWQQAPTQKFLAGMSQGLHESLASALQKGACPVPAELLGAHAGETLQNLRDYIEYGSVEAAKKARTIADDPPS
jgi:hypothetical protein